MLLFLSTDGSGTLLSPSSEIPPEILVYNQFARTCISLSSSCLLSVRFAFSCLPPQERRLSPAVRPNRLAAGAMLPLVSFPVSRCLWACPPPPTCAAGGTWLGCRWRGVGDGAPRNGLEFLDASTGVVWQVGFSWSPVEEVMSEYGGMC